MARTVLPIVGAVVGGIIGGPAGAQAGFAIGSAIGNAVDPQVIKGPRIGDIAMQTSQDGAPRAIVYGTAAVSGNVIDRGPIQKVIRRERQGKGGPVTETERLLLTFAVRICEGPIEGISRIWEDEKLVYDVRPSSTMFAESTKYAEGFTLYLGGEGQLPDPTLEQIHGVGNTPAHRGSAYIVFKSRDVTDRRGSVPQFRFEVNGCLASGAAGDPGRQVQAATFTQSAPAETLRLPLPANAEVGDYLIVVAATPSLDSAFIPAATHTTLGYFGDVNAGIGTACWLQVDADTKLYGVELVKAAGSTGASAGCFIVALFPAERVYSPLYRPFSAGVSTYPGGAATPPVVSNLGAAANTYAVTVFCGDDDIAISQYPYTLVQAQVAFGGFRIAICLNRISTADPVQPPAWLVTGSAASGIVSLSTIVISAAD